MDISRYLSVIYGTVRWYFASLQLCTFNFLEAFLRIDDEVAQNRLHAWLLTDTQSSPEPPDPVAQPSFFILSVHDTATAKGPDTFRADTQNHTTPLCCVRSVGNPTQCKEFVVGSSIQLRIVAAKLSRI
jgi:hypothetical protein